jgi:hypothetical protein
MIYISVSEEGFSFLILTHDDLNDWIEDRSIMKANSMIIIKFIYEDIIYRYDYPRSIIIDNGSENQGVIEDLLKYHRIKNLKISSYHPQSNTLIE